MSTVSQLDFIPTGWYNHIKPFQYYVEALSGFGQIAASPVFSACPLISDVTETLNRETLAYFGDNTYNYYRQLNTGLRNSISLKFAPYSSTFLKLLTKKPDYTAPSDNLASSLAFLRSFYQGSSGYTLAEKFMIYKGCRPTSVDCVVNQGIVDITADFSVREIVGPLSAHGFTTPTLVNDFTSITSTPWTHIDNGQLPLAINSVQYPCDNFHINWANDMIGGQGKAYNGSLLIDTNIVTKQHITGDFNIVVGKDTALETNITNATLVLLPATYKLKPTVAEITITDMVIKTMTKSQSASSSDEWMMNCTFEAKAATFGP